MAEGRRNDQVVAGKKDGTLLANLLSTKRELIRLFLIAALLAFSVGVLASLLVLHLDATWAALLALLLVVVCFALLARDLWTSLSFEDEIRGVVFVDPQQNETIAVRGYDLSEELFRTLTAVKAESRAIYSDWEKGPLVRPVSPKDPGPKDSLFDEQPSYVGVFKVVSASSDEEKPPKAAKLLEEAASFVLLERLSVHLSTYFGRSESDRFVKEYKREDIPSFFLANRVLNLLSTPVDQRDVFLDAFPDEVKKPDGELHSLWKSNGALYSRFDLVLPSGTSIQYSPVGTIKIDTKRLSMELQATYSPFSYVVNNSFISRYMHRDPGKVECRQLRIALRCTVRPLSLLTSSGWQYYQWIDSFRELVRHSFDFPTFQESIHWEIIEPLLYSMRNETQPAGRPGTRDHSGAAARTSAKPTA